MFLGNPWRSTLRAQTRYLGFHQRRYVPSENRREEARWENFHYLILKNSKKKSIKMSLLKFSFHATLPFSSLYSNHFCTVDKQVPSSQCCSVLSLETMRYHSDKKTAREVNRCVNMKLIARRVRDTSNCIIYCFGRLQVFSEEIKILSVFDTIRMDRSWWIDYIWEY